MAFHCTRWERHTASRGFTGYLLHLRSALPSSPLFSCPTGHLTECQRPLHLLLLLSGIFPPISCISFHHFLWVLFNVTFLARISLVTQFKILTPSPLPHFIFLHKIYQCLTYSVYFAIYDECCLPHLSKYSFHQRGDICLYVF